MHANQRLKVNRRECAVGARARKLGSKHLLHKRVLVTRCGGARRFGWHRIGSCKELPLCASHNPRRVRKIHLHIGGSIPPSPAVRSTRELHEDLSREGGQRAEGGQSGGRSANKTIEGGASCHQRMRPCLKIARVCEQGVPDGEEEFSREEECERQSGLYHRPCLLADETAELEQSLAESVPRQLCKPEPRADEGEEEALEGVKRVESHRTDEAVLCGARREHVRD